MTTIMELRESSLANAYDDLVEAHEKLTLDRDELRLDAVTQFGEVSGENMQLKKDLKRLINEKG
jgi:hypothetical protein